MTNEELVIRIKAGDNVPENMLQLWRQTKGFVYLVARRYQGQADMDDLGQEGYLALYDAVNGYEADLGYKFLTYAENWIKRRMVRYIQNSGMIKTPSGQCRIQTVSLDAYLSEDGETTLADIVPSDVDVEGAAISETDGQREKEAVWAAVAKLPEKQREVIYMRYLERKTFQEIGRLTGLTEGKARRTGEKALHALRYSDTSGLLSSFLPDAVGSTAYKSGVEDFSRTWTSATEKVTLKLLY